MPPATSTLITSTSKFTELIDDHPDSPTYFSSPNSDSNLDELLHASIAETLARGRQTSSGVSSSVSNSESGSADSSRQNSGDRQDGDEAGQVKERNVLRKKNRGSFMWGKK